MAYEYNIEDDYDNALFQLQKTVMIMNKDDYLPNNVDGKNEGPVTIYNNYGEECAELCFQNNMLNGKSIFHFNNNETTEINYVNNKQHGWSKDYRDGCLVRLCYFENGNLVRELTRVDNMDNFWKEVDLNNSTCYKKCCLDDNNDYDGKVYYYENDNIIKEIEFVHGKEVVNKGVCYNNNLKNSPCVIASSSVHSDYSSTSN